MRKVEIQASKTPPVKVTFCMKVVYLLIAFFPHVIETLTNALTSDFCTGINTKCYQTPQARQKKLMAAFCFVHLYCLSFDHD